VAPQFQSQLDEIARSLVQAFSEKDQSDPPTLPDMPGLFTWSGGTVPAPGTLVNGIAGTISVSAAVDPEQEGDPTLLRDGGINGAAYVANDGQGTGYSALLDAYVTGLSAPMAFDPGTGIAADSGILAYSSDSLGWLEQYRSGASDASQSKDAAASRSQDALSNTTGVNIDDEMSRLLDLEQSYKASAKMIATVNAMLASLLEAVG
jgi:flagellar hook-associated protein 1 FlgK